MPKRIKGQSESSGPPESTNASPDPRLMAALIASHEANERLHQILAAQVDGAIKTINLLVSAIATPANQTQAAATALNLYMEEASSTAGMGFERVHTAIVRTGQEQQLLMAQATRLQDATQTARSTLDEQRQLDAVGDKAHSLGRRIRMVALNTTIQAVRAGGQDTETIKVLASEISGLAIDVQNLGMQLKQGIETLSTRVENDVVNGVAKEALATAKVSQTLAQHVHDLNAAYQELKNFRETVWIEVMKSTQTVSSNACETLGGLQHQDIARQRMEHIAQTLEKIVASDKQLSQALHGGPALPPNWMPVQPQELQSSYVMADQRVAHSGNAEDGTEDQQGPAIELF